MRFLYEYNNFFISIYPFYRQMLNSIMINLNLRIYEFIICYYIYYMKIQKCELFY